MVDEFLLAAVENLYHRAIFKDALGKTCSCSKKCPCKLLKENIQKNLRMVLCDMILLEKIRKKNPTLV